MKVAVIGTGHVGLITSATMAYLGHDVTGNDLDQEKIEMLQRGQAPFFEPGLTEFLKRRWPRASSSSHLILKRPLRTLRWYSSASGHRPRPRVRPT